MRLSRSAEHGNGHDPGNGRAAARPSVRVALAGDLHCTEARRPEIERDFASLPAQADVVLLAGDLTTFGEPEEAAVLAEACRGVNLPVFAVLGNHDWHAGRQDEIAAVLEDVGVTVLHRSWSIQEIGDVEVGVVGCKGFLGGFGDAHLPDFGEPLLRQAYAETTAEVEALDEGLRSIAACQLQLVLLHYAPTTQTLEGERPEIWFFLGSDRLAVPIAEHKPDLVVHGHAHDGRTDGEIAGIPVVNASLPVIGSGFQVRELSPAAASPIH